MSTAIGNYSDFLTWNGSGSAYLTDNIVINDTNYSSSSNPFTLASGQTFDGKGKTITINSGQNFNGIFILQGGTIQHLNVVITSASLSSNSGWLVYGSLNTAINGAYGIIYNVSIDNTSTASMGSNTGGIVGAYASVATDGTFLITGSYINNLTIADCKYIGFLVMLVEEY